MITIPISDLIFAWSENFCIETVSVANQSDTGSYVRTASEYCSLINLLTEFIRINQISEIGSDQMSTRELVQAYYTSLVQHSSQWQELYTDDAVFADASHTLNAVGKPAVIQSFVPFLKSVKEVKLSRLIVDGERACAIVDYVYINPKGDTLEQSVAEVWQVKDDKFSDLIIYFDLTAYRTFMRG